MPITDKKFWFVKGIKYEILHGKDGVRRAYDKMAQDYDTTLHLYWTRKFERGEEGVIANWLGDLTPPVLDIGCGTGRYSLKIANRGVEVVALDFSIEMAKKTKEKAEKSGLQFKGLQKFIY